MWSGTKIQGENTPDDKQEILRKRPIKNNNETRIKLSEAILSMLGDFWEKSICSSLPARLMEEFPRVLLTFGLVNTFI